MNIITFAKVVSIGAMALSSLIVTAAFCNEKEEEPMGVLRTSNPTKMKKIEQKPSAPAKKKTDDPMQVIQTWEKKSEDVEEDDEEEDDDYEEVIEIPTMDDDEDESEEEYDLADPETIFNAIPKEGLMTYQKLEDVKGYKIPGSTSIKSTGGDVFDFKAIVDVVLENKKYYLACMKDGDELNECLGPRTKEQIMNTLKDGIPEPKEGQDVMDYLVMIDPYDIANRKVFFGATAPDADGIKYTKRQMEIIQMIESAEEEAEEDDDQSSTDEEYSDNLLMVVEKLFSNKETSRLYEEFMINARHCTEANYEEIYPVLNKFEELVNGCANEIKSHKPINRRNWTNRFSKVFHKAKYIIMKKEGEE